MPVYFDDVSARHAHAMYADALIVSQCAHKRAQMRGPYTWLYYEFDTYTAGSWRKLAQTHEDAPAWLLILSPSSRTPEACGINWAVDVRARNGSNVLWRNDNLSVTKEHTIMAVIPHPEFVVEAKVRSSVRIERDIYMLRASLRPLN